MFIGKKRWLRGRDLEPSGGGIVAPHSLRVQGLQLLGRVRGRPPFAPLALEEAALAADFARPPRRPFDAKNSREPNTRSIKSTTSILTSSSRQDTTSPAAETARRFNADVGTPESSVTAVRGTVMMPPLPNFNLMTSCRDT